MRGAEGAGALARLVAGSVTDAAALPLEHEPVPSDQVVAGAPTTGYAPVDEPAAGGAGELGVWEMTPGAMRDTEVDEVFLVIAGAATVEFIEPALPRIELRPGSVVRLEAGMRTVWTVAATLRKLFIAR
ncbi:MULTISPECIES: cupin domain-containing protein [unclassified Agromyces]|uniref:cupin domain-containing protein n=1 Tax=unclassified Agromyces TaxID=2639701 RepID=UPI0030149E46